MTTRRRCAATPRGGSSTRRAAARCSSVRSQTPTRSRRATAPKAAALLKQLDAAEAEEEALAALRARIDACAADGAAPLDLEAEEAETRRGFQALERLGCRGDDERSNRRGDDDDAADEAALAAAKEFLKTLGRKATGESSRALLVQVGVWDKHEDLQLIRHRVPIAFSDEVEAAAAALADLSPPDADAARRVDMTAQRAYAIDAPETTEVDDALGVESLGRRRHARLGPRCRRVSVRRARLGRRPGGAGGGSRRSTCRRGWSPMVPLRLAEDILSLRDGTPSCALSFGATLDADGALADVHDTADACGGGAPHIRWGR